MTLVMTEKAMTARCTELLPGEEVLATGLFQPYGTGVVAAGTTAAALDVTDDLHLPGVAGGLISAAAGLASTRGLAKAEQMPAYSVLAVTAERVYAFDARGGATGMTTTKNFEGPPYATWNRNEITVHVSRYVTSFTLSIDDHVRGRSYDYKGNELYKMGGKLVAHLLVEK